MLFKRILVPYDGSKPSRVALEKAADLAKATAGARLFILQVVPEVPFPILFDRPIRTKSGELTTMSSYFNQIYKEMRTGAKEKLQQIEGKCEESGIDTEIRVSVGNASDRIIEYATEKGIDLIVMSSRDSVANTGGAAGGQDTGGRKRRMVRKMIPKLLGSVSRTVADKAPCPVLLIRP